MREFTAERFAEEPALEEARRKRFEEEAKKMREGFKYDEDVEEARKNRRDYPGKIENKEAIEKKSALEQVKMALLELEKILEKQERRSPLAMRIQEAKDNVIYAINHAETSGPNQGLHKVFLTDAKGNTLTNPDGTSRFQFEGVPVDELIDILKQESALAKEETDKKLTDLRQRIKELNEKYGFEQQREDKAALYNQLEKTQKEYRKLEEQLDGHQTFGQVGSALAEGLLNNSKTYKEAHFGHGDPLSEEEQEKFGQRIDHEQRRVFMDTRASQDQDSNKAEAEDAQVAKLAMEKRRELNPGQEPGIEALHKQEEEIKEKSGTGSQEPKSRKIDRLLAVDASDIAELHARHRAEERLNEVLNAKGFSAFFKRAWVRNAEEFYRRRFIQEELAKIRQDNIDNVFGDPKRFAEHQLEMGALLQRFNEDLLNQYDGEQKKPLTDPEFNDRINDLIRSYAIPGTDGAGHPVLMTDEDFEIRKHIILQEINRKYPDTFGPGRMSADNFLEAAREFRKISEHSEGIARLDISLQVDLGIAKRAIKTEANQNFIDRLISKTQNNRVFSKLANPLAIGAVVSVGTYLSKKPAYFLAGAVGAGGIFGALRRAKDVTSDIAMHRTERAMGRQVDEYKKGRGRSRREVMDEFVYEMRSAPEIRLRLGELILAAKKRDPESMELLVAQIADVEARMSLGEQNSVDLIAYEGEMSIERSRLDLMRMIAEAKNITGTGENLANAIEAQASVLALQMEGTNKEFSSHKLKEAIKAGIVGGLVGGAIGLSLQEALDKVGVHPPDGKEPALERLWHLLNGQKETGVLPTDLSRAYVPSHGQNTSIHVPQGMSFVESTSGVGSLVDSEGNILVSDVVIHSDGSLSNFNARSEAVTLHSRLTEHPAPNLRTYIDSYKHELSGRLQEVHRHAHLMNETEKSDFNELRFHFGGVNGTAYDKDGNIEFDLSSLQKEGSWQGSKHPDIESLLHSGKIKILYTPDLTDQHKSVVLDAVDNNGHFEIPRGESWVKHFFSKDAAGRLTYPGILEAVIAEDDGRFTPIATVPAGSKFVPGNIESWDHVFNVAADKTRDWNLPPWIPIFPRKPLETHEGNRQDKYKGRQTLGPGIGEESDITDNEDAQKKIYGKKLGKTFIASRGQTIVGEKDLGAEYPEALDFITPTEMADRIIFEGMPVLIEDANQMSKSTRLEARTFIERRIVEDREKYDKTELKEKYLSTIKKAYDAVNAVMVKYGGENRSQMPSADKVHLVGFYEFMGQTRRTRANGLINVESGEIFINMTGIEMSPGNHDDLLENVIAHELTHGAVTNNYWGFEVEGEEEPFHVSRRSGLLLRRYEKNSSMGPIKERGRALNEAITEELAIEAFRQANDREPFDSKVYVPERKVLRALQERFKLNFNVFAEAVVNRRKLPDLVRALSKADKSINTEYVSTLLAIMDYESNRPQCRERYPQTMEFIKKGRVNLDETIAAYLPPKLRDGQGGLKQSIKDKYDIKVWGLAQHKVA